jgi:ribose transport system permease protein
MTQPAVSKRDFATLIFSRTSIIFFVVYTAAALIFVPKFANPENLVNILVQSSDLIILSCGMTFVFLNASIDFSVTAVLPLASVFGAKILTGGGSLAFNIAAAVAAMLATGVVIGVINGLAVTRLKMPSFIATMATQLIFAGIALTITQSSTIGNVPNEFNAIAQSKFLGVPIPSLITVVIVAAAVFILHFTVYGRKVFAVGTNQKASGVSGIPIKRTIMSLFVISGISASVACVIMTARLGAGIPSLGKDMLMDVVAAVVVGGTSVAGGEGGIMGTVVGAVLIVVLNNSLNLLGAEWYTINICKGVLILAACMMSSLRDGLAKGGR